MKTGLVVEGGGMKCAYTAAILDGFMDDDITFDYCIGVSAGAACVASFLGRQKDRNRRYFVEHVTDPRYIGVKSFLQTGSLFGLEYIYGDMTASTGKDPLDYPTFASNPAEFRAVATDALTGKPVYFTKKDVAQDDYRVFMATCAIPVASKPIDVKGKLYYDGGVSDSIPIDKAFADGCERLVVILCRPLDTIRSPQKHQALMKLLLHKYPQVAARICDRHNAYNEKLKQLKELEAEGKLIVIAPKEQLPVTTYTKDPKVLQGLYDTGVEEYAQYRERVKNYLYI